MSVTDEKKIYESEMILLRISSKKIKDIIKIIKHLEELSLLINGVSKTFKNEARVQKGRFREMLLGTLSVSLLESL